MSKLARVIFFGGTDYCAVYKYFYGLMRGFIIYHYVSYRTRIRVHLSVSVLMGVYRPCHRFFLYTPSIFLAMIQSL